MRTHFGVLKTLEPLPYLDDTQRKLHGAVRYSHEPFGHFYPLFQLDGDHGSDLSSSSSSESTGGDSDFDRIRSRDPHEERRQHRRRYGDGSPDDSDPTSYSSRHHSRGHHSRRHSSVPACIYEIWGFPCAERRASNMEVVLTL